MRYRRGNLALAATVAAAMLPNEASAWERAKFTNYPAAAQCMSENLCVLVSCPAAGAPAFEMLFYEHGTETGEEIRVTVDGQAFSLPLPERGDNDLYRWPLPDGLGAALSKGSGGELVTDPGYEPVPLPLRGSAAAIKKVLSACGSTAAEANTSEGGRLSGLSRETDCLTATTTGVVVDRKVKASGDKLEGFRFKDEYGVDYINVDPPENRSSAHAQLIQMIVPGAKLRVEAHGFGAGAKIVVLSAVETVK